MKLEKILLITIISAVVLLGVYDLTLRLKAPPKENFSDKDRIGSLDLSSKKDAEPPPWGRDDYLIYPDYLLEDLKRQIDQEIKINQLEDCPPNPGRNLLPFFLDRKAGIFVYDVQARSVQLDCQDVYWYPIFWDTYAFSIKKDPSTDIIKTFDDIEKNKQKITLNNNYPYDYFNPVLVPYIFDQDYDYKTYIDYLKN